MLTTLTQTPVTVVTQLQLSVVDYAGSPLQYHTANPKSTAIEMRLSQMQCHLTLLSCCTIIIHFTTCSHEPFLLLFMLWPISHQSFTKMRASEFGIGHLLLQHLAVWTLGPICLKRSTILVCYWSKIFILTSPPYIAGTALFSLYIVIGYPLFTLHQITTHYVSTEWTDCNGRFVGFVRSWNVLENRMVSMIWSISLQRANRTNMPSQIERDTPYQTEWVRKCVLFPWSDNPQSASSQIGSLHGNVSVITGEGTNSLIHYDAMTSNCSQTSCTSMWVTAIARS